MYGNDIQDFQGPADFENLYVHGLLSRIADVITFHIDLMFLVITMTKNTNGTLYITLPPNKSVHIYIFFEDRHSFDRDRKKNLVGKIEVPIFQIDFSS